MLSIEPKDLKAALAAVKPAVNARSVIQTLGCVHVTSDPTGVYMTSTNTEMSIRRRLGGANTPPGVRLDLLLRLADLEKVANLNAKKDKVHFVPTDDGADAKAGNRTIALKTGGMREDWPKTNFDRGPILLEAQGDPFAAALKRSCLWASKDETRPHLTGVQVDISGDDPLLVSTDSYRLGMERAPANDFVKRDLKACPVIPRTTLLTAAKLMAKAEWVYLWASDETFSVSEGPGQEAVEGAPREVMLEIDPGSPNTTLVRSRVIEGRFPNWRQLIPDGYECEVRMPTAGLLEACQAAKALTTRNQPMRVAVNGDVRVKVEGVDTDPSLDEVVGGASIDLLTREAAKMEIGFNPDFACDAAAAATTDEVCLRLINPLRPAMFEAGELSVLLMPIRLNV